MHRFWDRVIQPVATATDPRTVVEIGSQSGALTGPLLEWCTEHDAVAQVIDPAPEIDVGEWRDRWGDTLVFHEEPSHSVLSRLPNPDLVLIDGDHNWYTVVNELRLIERRATSTDGAKAVVVLHDVDWPYGRRDLYYAPQRIPDAYRQPYARQGMDPDSSQLVADGINGYLCNALYENDVRNGVRTAIEDFMSESESAWTATWIPGWHGLAILAEEERLSDNRALRRMLRSFRSSAFLRERSEELELQRLRANAEVASRTATLRMANARVDELRESEKSREADAAELRRELDEARDRLGSLDRQRQAAQAAAEAAAGSRDELAKAYEDGESERDQLRRDRDDGVRQLDAAREALAQAQAGPATNDEVADRVKSLWSDLADAKRSLAHARDTSTELEQQVDAAQRALDQERDGRIAAEKAWAADRESLERVRALEAQAKAENAGKREAYNHEVDELEHELERVQNTVAVVEQERRDAEAAARASGEVAETLHARLDEAGRENVAARNELITATARIRGLEHDLGEIAALHERVGSLTEELQTARDLADSGGSNESDQVELRGLRAALDAQTAARSAAERRLAELEQAGNSGGSASDELRRLRMTVRVLEEGHETLDGQLSDLRRERDELRRQLDEAAHRGRTPTTESPQALRAAAREQSARLAFTERYATAVTADPDANGNAAPQLAELYDRREVLGPPGAGVAGRSVDVVICVHNALDDVRRCLRSLVDQSEQSMHLIVVNDGSGEETTSFLRRAAAAIPAIELIENPDPPHGYCVAANIGMRATTGDYVVLLNSDTIVTSGWLAGIVECGESDERIGLIGPLSNAASHQSVPNVREDGKWGVNERASWLTIDGVGEAVRRLSPRDRPRFPFINGFCYAIKRQVIDSIGYFDDELFAAGYAEENDYSHRARGAGFELAIADDSYVFHAKSRSYSADGRAPLAKRHYELFREKHGRQEIDALVKGLEADQSLDPLRGSLRRALADPAAYGRAVVPDPLTVVYVLPGLGKGGSGGSHSIYQEARGLRALGIPASIALARRDLERARSTYAEVDDLFVPFDGIDELEAITSTADVISATHFKSVALIAELYRRRETFVPAYYVQDYEPFFMSPDHPDYGEAKRSYTALPDQLLFAKTRWLCDVVGEAHGRSVAKVEPSLDERLFLPQSAARPAEPLRIAAMIRPRTPRRQPYGTVAVLRRLMDRLGDGIDVKTFGCGLEELQKITVDRRLRSGHRGLLRREEVSDLLATTHVFVDFSTYQAFGRTALEAMACGCVSAVPVLGGASEFVEDGENALFIDTTDEEASVTAIDDLLSDPARLAQMGERARTTATRFTMVRAAMSEYLVFAREHQRRFGSEMRAAGVSPAER